MSTHFPLLPLITDLYTKLTFELRVKGYFEIHYRPFICTYFNLKILVSFIFFLDNCFIQITSITCKPHMYALRTYFSLIFSFFELNVCI